MPSIPSARASSAALSSEPHGLHAGTSTVTTQQLTACLSLALQAHRSLVRPLPSDALMLLGEAIVGAWNISEREDSPGTHIESR
eukprot:3322055-Amphidinium_carterae.2